MRAGEDELKEIFLSEASDQTEKLNKLFTDLEKNHKDKKAIEAIFRITHTLKANAAGMGFEDIAGMAHVLEDIFNEIKNEKITLTLELFNDLFKANDTLCALINQISTPGNPVKFRGIKTKLEVLVKNQKASDEIRLGVEQGKTLPHTDEKETKELKEKTSGSKTSRRAKQKISHVNKDLVDVKKELEKIEEALQTKSPSFPLPDLIDSDSSDLKDNNEEIKIVISENIHIPVRKLDHLLNLVGELMIEKDRVIALGTENGKGRSNEYKRLQRITSELQYSVMDVRLVQVNVLFQKFHRIVRDVASLENKKVNLVLVGTENEIDRNILQIISDSLVHLVRNAVSHGIESPEERIKTGKSETGILTLSAKSEKDEVIIDIIDDGKGINPQRIVDKALEKGLINREMMKLMSEEDIINLIFEPGFSSAEKVTEVSGRGVGMDVVKKSIDSIGGMVSVASEIGKGTTITLKLPSSMAVKGALLFELHSGAFAIPLSYTKAVISIFKKDIHKVGGNLLTTHLGKNIPLIYLNDLFNLKNINDFTKDGSLIKSFQESHDQEKVNIIIISYNNKEAGFVVNKLLQQKEIVEKPLERPLENIKFISGTTIQGNGNVCLVLDAPSIFNFLFKNNKFSNSKSSSLYNNKEIKRPLPS